jgi:hypothetical protein
MLLLSPLIIMPTSSQEFYVALFLSWAFKATPKKLVRNTGYTIIFSNRKTSLSFHLLQNLFMRKILESQYQ